MGSHLLTRAADQLVGLGGCTDVAYDGDTGVPPDIALVEFASVPCGVHSLDARLAEILHRWMIFAADILRGYPPTKVERHALVPSPEGGLVLGLRGALLSTTLAHSEGEVVAGLLVDVRKVEVAA